MADTIHTTDIVSQFGDYYLIGSQNESRLYSLLRQPAVTPSICTPVITDDTTYQAALATIGDIVQAFQKAWTPKGELTFAALVLKLFNIKIDLELYPDELKEKWLGFLTNVDEPDRAKWPLIRWMMEKHLIPKIKNDMELYEYYKGSYVAPTPGTPGVTGQSMDGLRKIFRAGITAGSVNPLAVGPITNATAFDSIEEISDLIPDLLDSEPTILAMRPGLVRAYLRDKRNLHGTDVNYKPGETKVEFRENMFIEGLPSMTGTNDVFVTPKSNLLYLRRSGGMIPMRAESARREVSIMGDWYEGIGPAIPQLVWFRDSDDVSNSGT